MTDNLLTKIIDWAKEQEPIRALILEGSMAATEGADHLSDYDVNMFISDPQHYVQDESWLSLFSEIWTYVPDKTDYQGMTFPTRLVIFKDGIKVDFILYSTDVLKNFSTAGLPDNYDIGYRVLLDKDGMTDKLPAPSFKGYRIGRPTARDFIDCVKEFWFEAYHVAKYLTRNDLWVAKSRDWNTKVLLIRMIEWHERGKHGWEYRTHPLGKQMRSWVSADTWQELVGSFSQLERDDGWLALFATVELFGRISRETAKLVGCNYPTDLENNILVFAKKLKNEHAGQHS